MKNKTLATWLTLLGGPLGLHRFYLRGMRDPMGWLLPLPSLLGAYGLLRLRTLGVDDPWIWWLLPMLGLIVAGCALTAIVYGLQTPERWNQWFNPEADGSAAAGYTNWLTIIGVIAALMIGVVALMAALAMALQTFFEPNPPLGSLAPAYVALLRTTAG